MSVLDDVNDKAHELKGKAEQKLKDSKADDKAKDEVDSLRRRNQRDETVDTL